MSTKRPTEEYGTTDRQDDAVLGRYGYEQAFERTISRFASFAIAFSFISIATGIFTTYGFVLQSGGPAGIWTWPLVGIGQGAVALVFAALAARIPPSGYSCQWGSRLAAMSRDGRFPGHGLFSRVNAATDTPVWATVLGLGVVWTLLIASAADLFSAATLLPALIYAGTVLMYLFTRGRQAEMDGAEDEEQRRERFSLGRWEAPVVVVALAWLALELWILMDAQFRVAQLYVLGMVGVGALYYVFMRQRNPEVLRGETTDPDRVD